MKRVTIVKCKNDQEAKIAPEILNQSQAGYKHVVISDNGCQLTIGHLDTSGSNPSFGSDKVEIVEGLVVVASQ